MPALSQNPALIAVVRILAARGRQVREEREKRARADLPKKSVPKAAAS